jgi:hypothetical protein
LVSLEFGAASMRFSAAVAMFAWMCMCNVVVGVFSDQRPDLVWPLWLV